MGIEKKLIESDDEVGGDNIMRQSTMESTNGEQILLVKAKGWVFQQ
jgi:hypothetical protein